MLRYKEFANIVTMNYTEKKIHDIALKNAIVQLTN
jgi:hypothetical protein